MQIHTKDLLFQSGSFEQGSSYIKPQGKARDNRGWRATNIKKDYAKNEVDYNYKLKPENVNHSLRLVDIGLANFSGCYKIARMGDLLETLRDIARVTGSRLSVLQLHNTGKAACAVTLCINNIRVCDGYGPKNTLAKRDMLRTAFAFFRSKGVNLWDPMRIPQDFVLVKTVEDLGDSQKDYHAVMQPIIQKFLSDPDLVQLRFDGLLTKKGWKRAALRGTAKKHKLQLTLKKVPFRMSKVNSLIHKLRVNSPSESEEERSGRCQIAAVPTRQVYLTFSHVHSF